MLEHRLAKLAAVATFFLLIIGGTVNPTGSSLACPEPTFVCHGQILPPMTGGVFYEHGHRLAAMSVGLLQIALTILLIRRRREMTRLALLTLAMVCAQGGLGAITVAFKLPPAVSTGHLLLGMSYFATLIYVGFRTRRERAPERARLAPGLIAARRFIGVAAGFVAVQVLLGGLVRHLGATLVCLDIPFCEGHAFPAPWIQRLQMIHRGFGVLTAVVTIAIAILVWRRAAATPLLRWTSAAAALLVLVQIGLGVYTVLSLRAPPVAVAHFAGAAGLWALWVSMWLYTGRVPVARLTGASPRELPQARAIPSGAR